MKKKYIIAVDTNLHAPTDRFRTFMFTMKKRYNTKKEAEKVIEKKIKEAAKQELFYYTIIEVYTNEK